MFLTLIRGPNVTPKQAKLLLKQLPKLRDSFPNEDIFEDMKMQLVQTANSSDLRKLWMIAQRLFRGGVVRDGIMETTLINAERYFADHKLDSEERKRFPRGK